MPETKFSDDLKHVARDIASRARAGFAQIKRRLQPAIEKVRSLPVSTRMGVAASAVAIVVFAGALALRGETTPAERERPPVRTSEVRLAHAEARHARGADRSFAVGKVEESQGSYKAAAESYATAAKSGDARGLKKLVAMTHSKKCEARSEAADALGMLRDRRAVAALKKLARGHFKDESRNPGIFSCSSRRAAQKALERQGRG